MNAEREAAGQAPAANPRNAAAGTIRTLEPNVVAQRRLELFAYFLLRDGEMLLAEQSGALEALRRAGFLVNKYAPHGCIHGRGLSPSSRSWSHCATPCRMRSTASC